MPKTPYVFEGLKYFLQSLYNPERSCKTDSKGEHNEND